jgi:hypothetical protein
VRSAISPTLKSRFDSRRMRRILVIISSDKCFGETCSPKIDICVGSVS